MVEYAQAHDKMECTLEACNIISVLQLAPASDTYLPPPRPDLIAMTQHNQTQQNILCHRPSKTRSTALGGRVQRLLLIIGASK